MSYIYQKVRSIFFATLILTPASVAAVNVNFSGELTDRPCQVDDESLTQVVSFDDTSVSQFNTSPGKTRAKQFELKFINCESISMWKLLKIKFTGTPELNMGGAMRNFLKVDGANNGRLAVGLFNEDGSEITIGDLHSSAGVTPGADSIILKFNTYVQSTPDAQQNKTVLPGEYTAIAHFEVFYE